MSHRKKSSHKGDASSSTYSMDSHGEYLHTIASKYEAGDTWQYAFLKNTYGWTPYGNFIEDMVSVKETKKESSKKKGKSPDALPVNKNNMPINNIMPANFQHPRMAMLMQHVPPNYPNNCAYPMNFHPVYHGDNSANAVRTNANMNNVMGMSPTSNNAAAAAAAAAAARRTNYNGQWWIGRCEDIRWVDSPNISDSSDDEEGKEDNKSDEKTAPTSAQKETKTSDAPAAGQAAQTPNTNPTITSNTEHGKQQPTSTVEEGVPNGARTTAKTESNEHTDIENTIQSKFSDMFSLLLNNNNKDSSNNNEGDNNNNTNPPNKDNTNVITKQTNITANDYNVDADIKSQSSDDSYDSDSTMERSSPFDSDDEMNQAHTTKEHEGETTTVIERSMAKDVYATSFTGAVYRMLNDKSTTVVPCPPPEDASKPVPHSDSTLYKTGATAAKDGQPGKDAHGHDGLPETKTAGQRPTSKASPGYKGFNIKKPNAANTDGVRHNDIDSASRSKGRTNESGNAESTGSANAKEKLSDTAGQTTTATPDSSHHTRHRPAAAASTNATSTYDFAQMLKQQREEELAEAGGGDVDNSAEKGAAYSIASSPGVNTMAPHRDEDVSRREESSVKPSTSKAAGAVEEEDEHALDHARSSLSPQLEKKSRSLSSSASPGSSTIGRDHVVLRSKDYSLPPAFFLNTPMTKKLDDNGLETILFACFKSTHAGGGLYQKESHMNEKHSSKRAGDGKDGVTGVGGYSVPSPPPSASSGGVSSSNQENPTMVAAAGGKSDAGAARLSGSLPDAADPRSLRANYTVNGGGVASLAKPEISSKSAVRDPGLMTEKLDNAQQGKLMTIGKPSAGTSSPHRSEAVSMPKNGVSGTPALSSGSMPAVNKLPHGSAGNDKGAEKPKLTLPLIAPKSSPPPLRARESSGKKKKKK